jgi:O-antigen/teichoic acid export membrane protein
LFRKIINTFGTKLFTAILNLLIAVAISQYLGASGKGEQGIFITTIVLILIFSNIIGGPTIIYMVPRQPLKNLVIPAYIWSLLISFIFYFLLDYIRIIGHEYILHVAVLTTINSFAAINLNILIGKERVRTNNYINLLQVVITISSLLFYFHFREQADIFSYIRSLYIAYSASFILSFIFIAPYLKKDRLNKQAGKISDTIRSMIKYGLWNQAGTIAQMLSFRISYYFIEYFNSQKDLGVYSNSVSIIESVWLISSSITLVQYSRIVNSDDDAYSRKLTVDLTRISLLLAFIVLIPLVILPSGFYMFIFGHEFGQINKVMWTLAPGVLIFNITSVVGHYFSGNGKYHINFISMLSGLAVTIVCGLLLIPAYGIFGAGITASISYIITSLIIALIFSHQTKLSIFELLPGWSDLGSYYREVVLFLKKEKQR